jgi:hypothetical protein
MKEAETDVAREFEALDRELVHEEFARVSRDLLRTATVTDFVPVLVRRHVRESLRPMVPGRDAARPRSGPVEGVWGNREVPPAVTLG